MKVKNSYKETWNKDISYEKFGGFLHFLRRDCLLPFDFASFRILYLFKTSPFEK